MAAASMRSRTRKGMIALLWLLAGTIAAVHAAMQYISIGSSRGSPMHGVGRGVAYRPVARQAMRGGSLSKRRSNIKEADEEEVAKPSDNAVVDGAGGIMLGGVSALGAAAILSNPIIAAVSVAAAGAAAFTMKRAEPETEETPRSNRSSDSGQQRSQNDDQAVVGAGDPFTGILRGGVAAIAMAGLYALSATEPMYALGAFVASAIVAAIMSFSSGKTKEEDDEEVADNVVEDPPRPVFDFFAGNQNEPEVEYEQQEQEESRPAFGFFAQANEPEKKQPQIEAPQPAFSFFGKKDEPQQIIEQDAEEKPRNLYDMFNYLGSHEPYETAEPTPV